MSAGLAYVRFVTEAPELDRIATMGEWRSGSDIDAALAGSAFEHMRATVRKLMDEGSCPPGDATTVALQLWSAAHGVASLLIAKPHLPYGDAGEFANRVLGAVFCGHIVGHIVERLLGADAAPQQTVEWLMAVGSLQKRTEGLQA